MEKKVFFVFVLVFIALSLSLVSATSSYSGKLQVTSGDGKIIISGPGQLPQHYCGNGIFEIINGEQCDGSDLGQATCASLGLLAGQTWTGTLSCQGNCYYDTSGCSVVTQPSQPSNGGGGGGGGGSSSLSTSAGCIESWECDEWGICTGGKQTRECEDTAKCGTTSLKPSLERECSVEGQAGEAGVGLGTGKPGITGAIIGVLGTGGTVALIFVIIIGIAALVVYSRKGKKK